MRYIQRRGQIESLESRRCLTVSFLPHDVLQSDLDESGTRAITAIDIDDNGFPDILSAGFSLPTNGKVALYRNLGSNRFERQQVLLAERAIAVQGMDVDSDGDTDVLAAVSAGLVWLPNQGNGVDFGAQEVISDVVARDIAIGDVDGDDDLDIVLVGNSTKQIHVLRNETDGLFTESVLPLQNVLALDLVDVDADGKSEIIAGDGGGQIFEFRAQAEDSYEGELIGETQSRVEVIGSTDIDGDSDLDIFVGGQDQLMLIRNRDDGLKEEYEITVSSDIGESGDIRSLDFADLDQDGTTDVLYATAQARASSTEGIFWYPNVDGQGTLDEAFEIAVSLEAGHLMLVEDLDKDGLPEVVSGGTSLSVPALGQIGFHKLADADPVAFSAKQGIATQGDGATWMEWADLNADGRDDLLALSLWDGRIYWHEHLGGNSFGAQQSIGFHFRARSLRPADFDKDGQVDFAVASADGVFVYENQGTHFVAQALNAGDAASVVTGDYDGDGDIDLLVDSRESNGSGTRIDVLIYSNETGGNGTRPSWGDPILVASYVDSRDGSSTEYFVDTAPQFIDFDADGDADIAQHHAGGLLLYENEGNLFTLREPVPLPPLFFPSLLLGASGSPGRPLRALDFDSDGDTDLLFEELDAVWFENTDGKGNFTPRVVPRVDETHPVTGERVFTSAETVGFMDADDDGDLDLIALGWGKLVAFGTLERSKIAMLENVDGVFQSAVPLDDSDWNASFTLGRFLSKDIDNDGDSDFAVGYYEAPGPDDEPVAGIQWYENRLTGDANNDGEVGFADFLLLSAAFGSEAATWDSGDFDLDGRVSFEDFLILAANFGND